MRVVNDRRSSARVTVRGEALVHAPKGSVRCRCLDLSPGGISLVCRQALKPKQRVRIESSFRGQRLVLEAVVVRRSRSREGHVLGLRFQGLEPRAREQLADVVRSMQLQAALAMQASVFVHRLPVLQVPEPEDEVQTERRCEPIMAAPSSVSSWPGGQRPVGLEEGWTEDELVTAHYRPSSEVSLPRLGRPEPPLPDWEVGAPMALAELVDTDSGSAWLGPVRTGKTMVVHVQELIAAYAPPLVEPELDLPEEPAPTTGPTTMPRLSDELQAALDRLRRREELAEPVTQDPGLAPARAATHASEEPAPRPAESARRHQRRLDATDVYAVPRRDDMQARALYHAALATLGDPERGDGS